MYKLNLFKYLLILILALTCFAIVPEIGQAQSPNPSSTNINDNINQIKIWVFLSYFISLLALGISIYLLSWKNNQKDSKQAESELNQLKQLPSRLTKVQNELEQLKNELNQLRSQPQMEVGNQENFPTEIENIKYQIKQIEEKINFINEKIKLTKNTLVEIYNHEPNRLLPYIIEVEESEITIYQRRTASNVSPVLIKSKRNKGIYWIIEIQETLYLVPKAKLKVNEFVLITIEYLFDCQNYQEGDSENFTLDKPAEVVSSGGESWELKEKGILQFE